MCRCEIFTTTTTTTFATTTNFDEISTTEEIFTTLSDEKNFDEKEIKKEEKFERNLENLTIFLLTFATIFAFVCFLVIFIWILKAKIYKKIPLITHRSEIKRGSNFTSETNSTEVSYEGCSGAENV